MKKLIGAALLVLPFVAGPARAGGLFCWNCPPYKVEAGANVYFRVVTAPYGSATQLGPWYQYWPLEAHFQTPAFCNYPYWPAPQVLPGQARALAPRPAQAAPAPQAPVAAPAAPALKPAEFRPDLQPAAYTPQVPSYWYGR